MSKITMTITMLGVNIVPGMEKLGKELFSERVQCGCRQPMVA